MERKTETSLAAKLMSRIRESNQFYSGWEGKFKCRQLNKYYEGKQWRDDPRQEAYVLNLFQATIDVKLPSLLFPEPQFQVTPRPAKSDFNPEMAMNKAQAATDLLNSVINKDDMCFSEICEAAILDSMFRFGMVEVGYSAKWIENPRAGKPAFEADYDPDGDPDKVVREPDKIPEEERIFVKHIPAERFRVGSNDSVFMEKLPWVAYYEYMRISDIRASDSNIKELPNFTENPSVFSGSFLPDEESGEDPAQVGESIKVWHVYDLRSKKHYLIDDGGTAVIWERKFERLPLFGLRFIKRTKGWYPIPVTYSWLSPQDEINEGRQQLRTHRRRSKRIFQMPSQLMEDEEVDKLVNGGDGTVVKTNGQGELKPVQNTPVDSSVLNAMQVSRDDLDVVSRTSQQQRGQSDRTTATEIQTINAKAQVLENKDRQIVAHWLTAIGREILLQAIEKFTKEVWVKAMADEGAFGADYELTTGKFYQMKASDLEGFDFDFHVLVETMSDEANDAEFQRMLKFLSVLSQYPVISLNPVLVREVAYRTGYRNEKVIKAMMDAAQLQLIGMMEQLKGQVGQAMGMGQSPQGGNPAQRLAAQMEPPDIQQTQNQIQNQLLEQ